MSRNVLASILIAFVAVIVLAVVVIVHREPPPPAKPLPRIGSIRDLKPVPLPATAPETQRPKGDGSQDASSENANRQ